MATWRMVVIALLLIGPEAVYAHAFGQRYDLPLPLSLYLTAAGLAVAFSFVIIAFLARNASGLYTYPRLNLLCWRVGRALAHPVTLFVCRLLAVAVYLIILLAGFVGAQSPIKNIAPTLVWVIWWIGLAYLCALVGDLWALINPWKTLFAWAETLYSRFRAGKPLSYGRPYPPKLGYWPAVVLFLAFAWSELVWDGSEIPRHLAFLVLGYSALTWAGMMLFGRETWLQRGEVFSVLFTLLARFAPLEVRVTNARICEACTALACRQGHDACVNCYDCFTRAETAHREWNLRPYAVGLLTPQPVHGSMLVFVLLLLATVSFDGFSETPLWAKTLEMVLSTQVLLPLLLAVHAMTGDVSAVIRTLGLVISPLLFIGVFVVVSWLMRYATATPHPLARQPRNLARLFVLTLVPIAVAYHLAHYLSFLLLAGQLVIPLASDPFGFGWNLWGTAHYRLNIGIINTRSVWFIAVMAIVVGHIVAVYLAHVMALRVFKENRLARRSQYPMLALMVGYTMVGLWILAQPIVK